MKVKGDNPEKYPIPVADEMRQEVDAEVQALKDKGYDVWQVDETLFTLRDHKKKAWSYQNNPV